tara:strand:+ start:59 stop:652 length:594 start_codon:yes stop_codon:yes gene_type:complete
MNGRENSIPEKKRIKPRCVRLRRKCELVRTCFPPTLGVVEETILACDAVDDRVVGLVEPFVATGTPFNFADATLLGNVSGRQRYRYIVSVTIKNSENPAAVAKGFALTELMVLNQAPKAGPNVKLILKHIPTNAIVAPLCFSSEISVAIAMASWTFPSDRPPTTRERRNVLKSVAQTQRSTLRILPAMLQRRAVRRP